MDTGQAIGAYAGGLLAFSVLDGVWLTTVAAGFYRRQIGHLTRAKVHWGAAVGFYLLYVVGVVALAVAPSLAGGSLLDAAGRGALLGLVAYGTYDLTNLAVAKGWPVPVTVVDLAWGTFLTAMVASAGYGAGRALGA